MPEIQDPTKVSGAKLVKPIPERMNQTGPTCGLYALSIVIRFWYSLIQQKGSQPAFQEPSTRGAASDLTLKERLNAEIRARGGQASLNPVKFSGVKLPANDLLQIAETLGSRVGEVMDADGLAEIARRAKLEAWIARWNEPSDMFDLIRHHIDRNMPLIVCYDNTDTGDPGAVNHGARAHWAVIFGYVDETPRRLLVTHGWGDYYLWSSEALLASNQQMDHFGKWGTWYRTSDRKTAKANWDGPGVPKAPSKLPSKDAPSLDRATPKDKVAGFFISHEMDVKNQFVIVAPPGVTDYSPPSGVATTISGTSGVGQTY